MERVRTPPEGVSLAAEAIRSGRSRQVLARLVACSRGEADEGRR